jgi:hypothetical protein
LNLALNNLGGLVLPEGWKEEQVEAYGWGFGFTHIDGRQQRETPGTPEGIIILADAIKDMGALTSLNLASNSIGGYTGGRDDNYKFIATPEGIGSHTQSYRTYPTRTIFSYCYRC